jgi:hypothetical protein
MDRLGDYLRHAKECWQAAEAATSPHIKAQLAQMAKTWEALARQRAAHLGLEQVLEFLESGRDDEDGPESSQ